MRSQLLSVIFLGGLILGLSSFASPTYVARSGQADLTLSIEQKDFEIEFKMSNEDLFGDTKTPSTDLEKETAQQIEANLDKTFEPFLFPPEAQCRIMDRNATLHFPPEGGSPQNSYTEIRAQYTCLNLEAISQLETPLFEKFSGLLKIKVQVVHLGKTKTFNLSPKSKELHLKLLDP